VRTGIRPNTVKRKTSGYHHNSKFATTPVLVNFWIGLLNLNEQQLPQIGSETTNAIANLVDGRAAQILDACKQKTKRDWKNFGASWSND